MVQWGEETALKLHVKSWWVADIVDDIEASSGCQVDFSSSDMSSLDINEKILSLF
jgi:hypothetical protein